MPLIYLGDPLYRLSTAGVTTDPSPLDSRPVGTGQPRSRSHEHSASRLDRLPPSEWQRITPAYEDWPVVEVAGPESNPGPVAEGSDESLLRWCQDAAIGELLASPTPDNRRPAVTGSRHLGLVSVLKRIRREQLGRSLRSIYDDLLIDALRDAGVRWMSCMCGWQGFPLMSAVSCLACDRKRSDG